MSTILGVDLLCSAVKRCGPVSVRLIIALAAAKETDRGTSSVIAAASSLPAAPWSPGIHGRVVLPSMHLTSEVPVEPLWIVLEAIGCQRMWQRLRAMVKATCSCLFFV